MFRYEPDSSIELISTEYPWSDDDSKEDELPRASEEIQATTNSVKTPVIKQYEFNHHKFSKMYKTNVNSKYVCREPFDDELKAESGKVSVIELYEL